MPLAVVGVIVVIDVCVEVFVSVTVRVTCFDDTAMNANNPNRTTTMADKAICIVPIALL